MLTTEQNRRLTETSRGTPMGELLRRHWHPIAAASEFDESPTKAVRLLGEDLVVYRDLSGTFGLLERHCSHRRADLSNGFVEEHGLRCSYHGWAFDECGRCVAQPFEDISGASERFRGAAAVRAYAVAQMAGLVFAYLGPDPVPVLPRWETFGYRNGFAQIVFAPVDCNWFQAVENDMDPVHFEWLHANWSFARNGRGGTYAPTHLRIAVDEYPFGLGYRRLLENETEDDRNWNRARFHLMPNIFVPGGTHLEYRVPVDDTHMMSVVWAWDPVPVDRHPYEQKKIPHWHAQLTDEAGRYLTSHVINQDTIAWVGQGVITDRQNEHLGRSDIGVVKLRRRFLTDLGRIERGEDPSGVFRDASASELVPWPQDRRSEFEPGISRADWERRRRYLREATGTADHFRLYAGQPDRVRSEYESVMGLPDDT